MTDDCQQPRKKLGFFASPDQPPKISADYWCEYWKDARPAVDVEDAAGHRGFATKTTWPAACLVVPVSN